MILEFADDRESLKPWLRVVYPPELASEHAVGPGPLVVGRSASHSTFVLDDEWVSRRHCRLYREDERVMVEDLGSMNGTYVGGCRISGPTELKPDDELQLGHIVLKLDLRTDAPEADVSPAAPPVPAGESDRAVGDFLAAARRTGVSVGAIETSVKLDSPSDDVRAFVMGEVTDLLRLEQLSDDLLAQAGPDSLLFLMNDISDKQIATFRASLRDKFERQRFLFEGAEIRPKISLRSARFDQAPETAAEVTAQLV